MGSIGFSSVCGWGSAETSLWWHLHSSHVSTIDQPVRALLVCPLIERTDWKAGTDLAPSPYWILLSKSNTGPPHKHI